MTPHFGKVASGGARRRLRPGFAIIITVSLLVLLAVVAVGLLTLGTVQIRAGQNGVAQSEARANAKLALMLALGELQKTMGRDQFVSAPASILDAIPETDAVDGVKHPFLTGIWPGRNEKLGEAPKYDRELSAGGMKWPRWLVSHKDRDQAAGLDFAKSGSFDEQVVVVPAHPGSGSRAGREAVQAGLVSTRKGAFAWWVGDENCKARVNRRDETARKEAEGVGVGVASLLGSFATPGAYGVEALEGFEKFPANTVDADRLITRETLGLLDGVPEDSRAYFHDLTPYSSSVLANVRSGGLRKDLNLYLERSDINWMEPWANADGRTGVPRAPLGPNGQYALSIPTEYDVLAWKYLHHWYQMERQAGGQVVQALDNRTPTIDPIANPGWNTGVTLVTPVMVRMQMLISFGTRKVAENRYQLLMYSYPVVTLWNPYNVTMQVPEWSVFLHTLPMEHTVYKNGTKLDLTVGGTKNGMWAWGWPQGNMVMRYGAPVTGSPLLLQPGQAVQLYYTSSTSGAFHAHDMIARNTPWSATQAGQGRDLGTFDARPTDRIRIETKAEEWETSGASYSNFQETFGFRCEPRSVHAGHPTRMRQQMFSAQVGWRRERSNPAANTISQNNFPEKTFQEVQDAPAPIMHLDVRLKTLDELQLPNKTWLHCMPSHPFVAATSTAKHTGQGVDNATTFYAHPYTVSFDEQYVPEGVFNRNASFGPSNEGGGLSHITAREIPLVPVTSLGQLQNLPQYPIEGLNWKGYFFQNHAIGNSFANPGVRSDRVSETSFPFYLGEYFAWQGGDHTGQFYSNAAHFTGADYTIPSAPAKVIDRSYAANQLLFDDYFFSSIAPQNNAFALRNGGSSRTMYAVARDFYEEGKPLPNAAYKPHLSGGRSAGEVLAGMVDSRNRTMADGFRKVAANLLVEGGFNVNSTSVDAWTVMLGANHRKSVVIMDAKGSRNPVKDRTQAKFVVSRFTLPNGGAAGNGAGDEELRWRGYRELKEDDIRALAEAVVQQVKERGPFRSLGEFVNRRLADAADDRGLYGALQAALEDEDVPINDRYRDDVISKADLGPGRLRAAYKFEKAALGPRYQGTPAYVQQGDLLMQLAPVLNARSDTFVIRGYGEARSADGKTVTARAWCEAVVQRTPEFLDGADAAETEIGALKSEANKVFGRRFQLRSFRWLGPEEVSA